MKKIAFAFTILVMLVLVACNSGNDKTEAITDSPKTAETVKPAEFKPFDVSEISITVKDYAKWRPFFNSDSAARKEHGIDLIVVGQSNENPNNLLIVFTVADTAKAKAFGNSPSLKEIMKKSGVLTKPNPIYFHAVRHNPESNEKQWVIITHKVKDFAAWLKVYDAEGTAKRAGFGLVDVAIARGLEDSTLVQVVFDIKDMTKAKARMNDPELKKIMTEAGVIGAPKIEFYTTGK